MRTFLRILRRLLILLIIAGGTAAAGVITVLLAVYVIIYSHFDGTAELPADCALVFGAAVYAQSRPGPAITRRVAAAAALYREEKIQKLILSGGRGEGVRHSEAQVMRAFAIELGVAGNDIIIEDESHSTWENIAHSKNLTSQCSSVVAVSDQYHLARIELLSWRQGWGDLQTVPAQDRPPEDSEKRSVYREVLAFIYYVFYIDKVLPGLPARAS
jgi:vancomycin permeability regulator SanA